MGKIILIVFENDENFKYLKTTCFRRLIFFKPILRNESWKPPHILDTVMYLYTHYSNKMIVNQKI